MLCHRVVYSLYLSDRRQHQPERRDRLYMFVSHFILLTALLSQLLLHLRSQILPIR